MVFFLSATVFIKRRKYQSQASHIEKIYRVYDEIDDNDFLATPPFTSRVRMTNEMFDGDSLNDYDDIMENDFSRKEHSSNHSTLQHLQVEEELVCSDSEALSDDHSNHSIRIYDVARSQHYHMAQWDTMYSAHTLLLPTTSRDSPQFLLRRDHSYEQIPSLNSTIHAVLSNWNMTQKEPVDLMAPSIASFSSLHEDPGKDCPINPTDVNYEKSASYKHSAYQYGSLHVYECVPRVNLALHLLLSNPSQICKNNGDEIYEQAPNVAIKWLVSSDTFSGPIGESLTMESCSYDVIQPYERVPMVDLAKLMDEIACSGGRMSHKV